jgi:hypothetical protein
MDGPSGLTGNFYGPKSERVRIDELADDFPRDYRINGKRSLADVEARWKLHLKPFFGDWGHRQNLVGKSESLVCRQAELRSRNRGSGLQSSPLPGTVSVSIPD